MLSRRLDELRREPSLPEDDPHRGHGGRAGAEVKGEGCGARLFAPSSQNAANRRLVDLPEIHRATIQLLAKHLDPDGGSAAEPFQVRRHLRFGVVREEVGLVEGTYVEGLGDRAHPDLVAFVHCPEIRLANPGDEDLAHQGNLQGTLFHHNEPCVRRRAAGWLTWERLLARRVKWTRSMTNTIRNAQLAVSVVFSSDEVAADVRDRRPDVVGLFGSLNEGQRGQLVHDAWTIGIRALHNAQAAAQEARLQDVGSALVADIERHLRAHVEEQQKTMASTLSRYFDPRDGQVMQRLTAFVDDRGVLARLLDKYLAPKNSVLAESLAKQVGETSPLFKKLSPTDSGGLIKLLESQLQLVMDQGHAELVRALDPLAEDGAVARFLRSLREELKGADEDRSKQLSVALAALDANDESSLLSRLVRETQSAREEVTHAVNPDAPGSPMAILKASLTKLLQDQAMAQGEQAKANHARQAEFEKEVREALARIETKRTLELKTPRGGFDFEDAVISFVRAATKGAPCIFEATATTSGVGRCKKGDAVLRFTAESQFAGAGVVFEAKRDASYTVQKALDELDGARKNRNAVAGVFVMAKSHANAMFPVLARYGSNVLVIWDDQDPASDAYLHAAVILGMGLVTRSKTTGEPGDIAALRDVESRIEAEVTRLEKMEKYTENIRKNGDGLTEEIRKAQKALDGLLRKAQSTLRALNVELRDEAAERGSPISLPSGSLQQAVRALPSGGEAA